MKLLARLVCLVVIAQAGAARAEDSPEISRSVGARGGVLVFWPRVIPRTDTASSRPFAAVAQQRLIALAGEALPGMVQDVRPEPERVCPRAGCQSMTVGVLLLRKDAGCVAVGLFSPPGKAVTTLVPWVGEVRLKTNVVGFREPPESQVTVVDWAPCAELETQLGNAREKLVAAMRGAAGR